jgi:hypothetical protein
MIAGAIQFVLFRPGTLGLMSVLERVLCVPGCHYSTNYTNVQRRSSTTSSGILVDSLERARYNLL